MKILQFGKFYPPNIGGIETVVYDVTEVLNSQGIQCDVLCSNDKNEYREDKINGYTVYRTPSYGIYFSTSITPYMIKKLREIINNYDIVHVHLPDPMANLALFFSNLKNTKIILHWHSDIIKQKLLLQLYRPLQNWLLNRADKIIATTPKYIEESSALNKYKEKCVSIPIGIDAERLIWQDKKVHEIKNTYQNKKIIFSLGRLAYYKGFEYLIDSANYLDDDFVILIGGSGELKCSLEEKIKNENLNGKVFLLGRIENEDLGSFYKACDLFCLPSIVKSEAFGVVQIEAMSFGKPIVATKISGSGVDWVNKDSVTGINVDIKNSEQLALAFKKILVNQKLYKELSQNSLFRFNKLFLREKMVESIYALYQELGRM